MGSIATGSRLCHIITPSKLAGESPWEQSVRNRLRSRAVPLARAEAMRAKLRMPSLGGRDAIRRGKTARVSQLVPGHCVFSIIVRQAKHPRNKTKLFAGVGKTSIVATNFKKTGAVIPQFILNEGF